MACAPASSLYSSAPAALILKSNEFPASPLDIKLIGAPEVVFMKAANKLEFAPSIVAPVFSRYSAPVKESAGLKFANELTKFGENRLLSCVAAKPFVL